MIEVTLHHLQKRELLTRLKSQYRRQLLNFATLSDDQYGQVGELRIFELDGKIVLQANPVGIPSSTMSKILFCLRIALQSVGQYTIDNAIALGDIASGQYMAKTTAYTILGDDNHPVVHLLTGVSDLTYGVLRQQLGQTSNCCPNGLPVTVATSGEGRVTVGEYVISHEGPDQANAFCVAAFEAMYQKAPTVLAHLVQNGKAIRLMPVL